MLSQWHVAGEKFTVDASTCVYISVYLGACGEYRYLYVESYVHCFIGYQGARLEVNTAIRRQYYWVRSLKHSVGGRLNVKGTRALLELIRA